MRVESDRVTTDYEVHWLRLDHSFKDCLVAQFVSALVIRGYRRIGVTSSILGSSEIFK